MSSKLKAKRILMQSYRDKLNVEANSRKKTKRHSKVKASVEEYQETLVGITDDIKEVRAEITAIDKQKKQCYRVIRKSLKI